MNELKELSTLNKRISLDSNWGSLNLTGEHGNDFATVCSYLIRGDSGGGLTVY